MKYSLLLVALTFVGCREAAPEQAPPSPRGAARPPVALKVDPALFATKRLATTRVERRVPTAQLTLPGEVQASLSAAEVGALVSGRITSILVVEGARVERGQVLAWLDAPEVAHATADVLRARAREALASRNLTRQLELEERQATSKNALDDARAEAEVARVDLLAARTLLHSLGGSEPPEDGVTKAGSVSARIALRAPVQGVVVRRDAVIGGAVTPERALFWLRGGAPATIVAHVPEGVEVPRQGERATLEARTSAVKCEASVSGEPGVVEAATRRVALQLRPDPSCGALTAGAYVDVTFARPTNAGREGLVVPREAVVDVRGVSMTFILGDRPGQVSVRPVRVLDQGGPELLVESGLKQGDQVIGQGAVLLKGELLRAELMGESP